MRIVADIADATTRLACEALGKQHEMTPKEYKVAVEAGQKSASELLAKVNESVSMLQQEHCVKCIVPPTSGVLTDEPEPEPEDAVDDAEGVQKSTTHDLKSLRDLRSRALLYVNTSFQARLNDDEDDEVDTAEQQAADEKSKAATW